MSETVVEVLTFQGCPHAEPALDLARRVVADSGLAATVRRIDVPDDAAAAELQFLGSPTIRVNGRDIEPGAGENSRPEYVLSCRVYRTEDGFSGEPDERWLLDALRTAV